MKRQREMEQRLGTAPLQSGNSSGNVAGKVIAGAAVVGGAMLLKHIFGSDKKDDKAQTQIQNNIQPSNK